MAKIALIFPTSACGRTIDQSRVYEDARGLTGSEVAFWETSRRLLTLGHDVTTFGNFKFRLTNALPDSEWPDYADDPWDTVVSYVHPEPLRLCNPNVRRVFVQQCNDFAACPDDWTLFTDYLVAPGRMLLRHLLSQTNFPPSYARVFHNGHALEPDSSIKRVPGRLLWASSHDRGLHWALQVFQQLRKTFVDPETREVFPPLELELHVAYNQTGMDEMAKIPDDASPVWVRELGRRSRYCKSVLPKLEEQGVRVLGSVSRDQMVREMQEAEILLYPCDPVNWTEGFSNTTCEAMALGCLPVLIFSDAFQDLWKGAVPGVDPLDVYAADGSRHPTARFLLREKQYISLVRSLLTGLTANGLDITQWRKRAAERASHFHWDKQVNSFAEFLCGNDAALPGPDMTYPWEGK